MSDEGLDDLALFVRLVELGSFSAAARALHLPKSSLSRRLDAVEQRLGVTLMLRRASGLAPTNDGQKLYEQSLAPLRELARAQEEARQAQHGRGGLLRISAPPELGRPFLVPALARLMSENRDLALEVELGPRAVDLLSEGFDAVIRSGRVDDAALRVRLLFRVEAVLVASPGYLRGRPAPQSPADLPEHPCLRLTTTPPGPLAWTLDHARMDPVTVALPAALAVNDLEAICLAARSGLGVARLPALLVTDDLAEGRLVRVLPEWSGGARAYYLAHPAGRLTRRHRLLVDALVAEAARHPR
jgi:DNA-binding transcriptional LysR family regulator